MNAGDVMTAPVITASPTTPVADLARIMLEHRISGLPVVEDGRLIGIVSEGDLVRRLAPSAPRGLLAAFMSRASAAASYLQEHGNLAIDVMSRDVISAGADTPVSDLAATMERCAIKRVPVLDDTGALIGIVTRANLLHALAQNHTTHVVSDKEIRRNLVSNLQETGWASNFDMNAVMVADGIVHLWGPIADNTLRRALITAAQAVRGVREVVDHMTTEG